MALLLCKIANNSRLDRFQIDIDTIQNTFIAAMEEDDTLTAIDIRACSVSADMSSHISVHFETAIMWQSTSKGGRQGYGSSFLPAALAADMQEMIRIVLSASEKSITYTLQTLFSDHL